jgi:hypothetical protein
MRNISIGFLAAVLISGTAGLAAEKTWTGKISDSMCGASHKAMEHGGKKVDDRECTLACVKGGSKYVFVSQGKVYEVQNQDFAGLQEHAGHTVKLTGEMSADGKGIKVSKVEMPPAKGKKAA